MIFPNRPAISILLADIFSTKEADLEETSQWSP